jgi:hypothetical protein
VIHGTIGAGTLGLSNTTTSKPTPIPSSTKPPGNGIATPLPTQPDIVSSCDAFHLVKANEPCNTMASSYGITLAKFLALNHKAGSTCAGLWADAYACVSIIGEEADTTTSTPTTTSAGTGISTPQPTQAGMVNTCNKFSFVPAGVNAAKSSAPHPSCSPTSCAGTPVC